MSTAKDYKDTLNLPQTAFPMKANLPQREPQMLALWQDKDIYRKCLRKNQNGPTFLLHDGPPYANGHIHIGHVLNKVLKDIIVKYKIMKGFYAPYLPGWDCHGLPIELQVDKSLGARKHEVGVLKKRELCRDYAWKFVQIQREEFKRLGVFALWEEPYLTMEPQYVGAILEEFHRFVKEGYVYRGKKPVHWCASCITALAEAEVEYAEKTSPSIYVLFELEQPQGLGLRGPVYLVVWTTTPWTLPANLALAVNAQVRYGAYESPRGILIVAEALAERLRETLGLGKALAFFTGKELEGLSSRHPFLERHSRLLTADFVTTGEGTGVVHIAPGHGEEDYELGLREGLPIYAPVDDRGRFSSTGVQVLEGLQVFKANDKIIEILQEKNALASQGSITHTYPHCWRCKRPVLLRATEQWFISLQHKGLRERCLQAIEQVRWVPAWGKERIRGMLRARPDWCISRQRAWGVPIALLWCRLCGEVLTEAQVLQAIQGLLKQHGSDVWFQRQARELLPQGYRCPRCGAREFEKETDILDVWFDSGASHAAVLKKRLGHWPAELYLEGSDQHRGWFQSSLICAVGTSDRAPFKEVLTHGFVVDGQGRKMSKSLGNVVAPEDVIKARGAEVLRLWVSAEQYRADIRLSEEILARLTEAYRKLRNTARFLLGNLYDFDGGDYSPHLWEIDRWALSRLQGLIRDVDAAYQRYEFHEVYHRLYNFCVLDMSAFYLDILKDRLYTFAKDSEARRAAQWSLRKILLAMARLMAPVLSFTAEEIWSHMQGPKEESVFLAPFPQVEEELLQPELEARWQALIEVRQEVNRALEHARRQRLVGNSLEAKVLLYAQGELLGLLQAYRKDLPMLFIVSQVELKEGPAPQEALQAAEVEGLAVLLRRAEGRKCLRCWNWSPTVGANPEAPELCSRCQEVVP